MAQGVRCVCEGCGRGIEAWSDGNPYFIDEDGAKQYAYHPDHERLARCIGNDEPHLCLSCGHMLMVDSRSPTESCPSCSARNLKDAFRLVGERCPYCDEGRFIRDRGFNAIS